MSEGFLIGPNLRHELRLLVDERRNAIQKSEVTRLETRFEELPARQGERQIRVCEFTGTWELLQEKRIVRRFGQPPATMMATNLLYNLEGAASTTRTCIVGKDGTGWYLVSAGATCGNRMAGKEISAGGYDQEINTLLIKEVEGTDRPAALFLASGCVEWVKADRVRYVSDVTVNKETGMMTVKHSSVWAFTPQPTSQTVTTSLVYNTVVQSVVTRITLSEESLLAERADLLVLGVTPATSTEIAVYECSTATPS